MWVGLLEPYGERQSGLSFQCGLTLDARRIVAEVWGMPRTERLGGVAAFVEKRPPSFPLV